MSPSTPDPKGSPEQWTADDCICNEVDDCYGDDETPPESPFYRFCPYCHYVGGLCPGREESP